MLKFVLIIEIEGCELDGLVVLFKCEGSTAEPLVACGSAVHTALAYDQQVAMHGQNLLRYNLLQIVLCFGSL